MRINPLLPQSDKKLSRRAPPSGFFRLALARPAQLQIRFNLISAPLSSSRTLSCMASIRAPMLVALAAPADE